MRWVQWPGLIGNRTRFEMSENLQCPGFRCLHEHRIGYAPFLSLGYSFLEARPLRDHVGFVFRKSDPAIQWGTEQCLKAILGIHDVPHN